MSDEPQATGKPGWEQKLIEELARNAQQEQRRTRRWGIFFKLLTFGYLIALVILWTPDLRPDRWVELKDHTAVVEVKGIIADDAKASADNLIKGLRNAFEDKHTKGVVLRINSPGGSPVQAGYVNDEIRRLRKKYPKIPVYAVVTDLCASGGYYIAVAADKIYVDKASIVGSIGVLMNGFGFEQAMEELGIERRLLTAGEHKGIMDPFSPMSEFDRDFVQGLLGRMHQQFIQVVKDGRGERLKIDEQTFSGLFWSGEEAVERGLADALGSTSLVAREVIGAEKIIDFTPAEDLFDRLAKRVGAGAAAYLAPLAGLEGMPLPR
jgi:protease IV